MIVAKSQWATSWTIVEDNIPNAMNARGGLLTTWRRDKVANSSRSIDDESNFGDLGYEVTAWHVVWRKKMEQRRSCMCWRSNSGRTWSCTDIRMSCNRNKNNSGRNMHSQMKLHSYNLGIHPSSWHKAYMVSSFVDCMQGIHEHACRWAHTWNPTNSIHSPRLRQESSPNGAEHVLWQVDAHDH